MSLCQEWAGGRHHCWVCHCFHRLKQLALGEQSTFNSQTLFSCKQLAIGDHFLFSQTACPWWALFFFFFKHHFFFQTTCHWWIAFSSSSNSLPLVNNFFSFKQLFRVQFNFKHPDIFIFDQNILRWLSSTQTQPRQSSRAATTTISSCSSQRRWPSLWSSW